MAKTNRFNVLARLFSRTGNNVIAQLYTHALNRPLLVHPVLGEALLGAYMQGDVDYPSQPATEHVSRIGIMNISGALASRPMPGPSGAGPQNYEQMSATFMDLVADDTVSAIILRLDTPGGFASGLFDFTDLIFEARAEKPIHAVIDDMAYSAGYAIAAAAENIWISRTGGVGSVGVVAYHTDQSEYDRQQGVKITPIYAGAHKIDFSPHFALSDSAKERYQADIDDLYTLFAESVAKYRAIDAKAVRATEASTYNAAGALKVGFADELGTLADAIVSISESQAKQPTLRPGTSEELPAPAAAPDVPTVLTGTELAEAAELSEAVEALRVKGALTVAVMAADLPVGIKHVLLGASIEEEDIDARIAHAKDVLARCQVAKADGKAEAFVKRHVPLDEVAAELLEEAAVADDKIKISTTLPAVQSSGQHRVPGAWDKTIKSFGGTLK